mmetsp:Transcript_18020/g.36628  ORF Transcript_18020/g.36628 Transcript_18020/m.36628 type:complete len:1943 (+) Transcript_18020:73-5901(+)
MPNLPILFALFKKCLLRRCRSSSGALIPIGFILQVAIPVLLFYLFSQVSEWIPPETVSAKTPGDVYSINNYLKIDEWGGATFTEFMERGYAPGTKPLCVAQGGGDFDVMNKDSFLLDCTPGSSVGYDWAQTARVEDACLEDGEDLTPACQMKLIGLAPSNAIADDAGVAALIQEHKAYLENSFPFSVGANNLVKIFDSESALLAYLKDDSYGVTNSPLATGIVWNSAYPNFDYTIRLNVTDSLDTNKEMMDFDHYAKDADAVQLDQCYSWESSWITGASELGPCGERYLATPFVKIQAYLVDSFLLNKLSMDTEGAPLDYMIKPNAAGYPSDEWTLAIFWQYLGEFLSSILYLAFIMTFYNTLKQLTEEKELKLSEGLKMMGVTDLELSLSWWMLFILEALITTSCLMLTAPMMYIHSSIFVVFMYFFMFLISCQSFCIFLAKFFDRANRAGMIGLCIFLAGMVLANPSIIGPKFLRVIVALGHPATLFFYLTDNFVFFESREVGVTSNTISSEINDIEALNARDCFILMFFDTFLFAFLAWYVEKVKPSEFGVALPPHFFLMPSYWKTGEVWSSSQMDYSTVAADDIDLIATEDVGEELKRQVANNQCVQIKGLNKVYHTNNGPKVAVEDLTLNFYKGQISCLLGHNGAGKTTTISILNGMTKLTKGVAKIGPHSVASEMNIIRKKIGVCPQHDVLFKTLTVSEHLRLFATIKGIPSARHNDLIKGILEDVGMPEKYSWYASTLSGGQKRKLSLAIAFLGDSEVVFLDEPTSGMDPYSRRFTWDVIRRKKSGKVIVLTTHFMDEADLLGDRIAIMSEGSLRCVGSSLFLKKEYGVGYNIILEKNSSGRCDDAAIDRLVKGSISDAELLSSVGMEVSYQLPLEAAPKFPDMLTTLDNQLTNLGLVSYGISVTTLEEVFLTIARSALRGDADLSNENSDNSDTRAARAKVQYNKIDASNSFEFFKRHLTALLHKRFIISKRDWGTWITSYIMPMAFIALGMYGTMIEQNGYQYESKDMTVQSFSGAKSPVLYNAEGVTDCYSSPYSYACEPDAAEYDDPWARCKYDSVSSGFMTQRKDRGPEGTAANAISLEDELFLEGYFEVTNAAPLESCYAYRTDEITTLTEEVEWAKVPSVNSVAPSVGDFATELMATRNDYKESRFGSLLWTSTPMNPENNTLFYNASTAGGVNKLRFDSEKFVEYVAIVNFTSAHALPSMMNLAHELIAKTIDDLVTITTRNHPFPKTLTQQEVTKSEAVGGTIFCLMVAFPFVPASFASFAISERVSKSKHIQMVSGVSSQLYWLSMFIWDFSCFLVSAALMIILLYAFDIEGLTEDDTFGVFIALILSWGAASATFGYCWSFFFSSSMPLLGFTVFCSFVLGYMASLVAYILDLVIALMRSSEDTDKNTLNTIIQVYDWMTGIGRFFPTFNLGLGLQRISNRGVISAVNNMGTTVYDPWHDKIAKQEVIFLLASIPGYFLLCLIIQHISVNPKIMGCISSVIQRPIKSYEEIKDWDDDVSQENLTCDRIASGPASQMPTIVVNGLKKQYGLFNRCGKPKLAVKSVSFSVEPGTCFGLLGVNGAGKTSTLGMITGEFAPSAGECYLDQKSILKNSDEIKRVIGYCPQFDALFPLMTGREHLKYYARLKGVLEKDIEAVVNEQIKRMDLTAHCDRVSKGYSGGNRRKLSVACALIGDPKIVFLDEPSTGMDPLARRFMWSIVNQITREMDTSVILTTHSMEECEALCGKLGIMVDGYFRCIGSGQHLKNKFGRGFQIEINVFEAESSGAGEADNQVSSQPSTGAPGALGVGGTLNTEQVVDKVLESFRSTFQHFKMLERQGNRMRISLGSLTRLDGVRLTVAQLFGTIEGMKESLKIRDYSITQTSLEQIFNQFATLQMFSNADAVHSTPPQVSPISSDTQEGGDGAGYLPPNSAIEMTRLGGEEEA